MSRLRANEVLDKAGFGPFLASEGMNIPVGKDITYVNGVTTFDEEILTTRTINVNRINISDNAGTNNVWTEGRLGLEDDASLYFGDSDDLRLHHDGTAGVSNITSDLLVLRAKTGLEDPYITCTQGGSVQLRYDGTPRFETTSTGVAVSGVTTSTAGWAGTTSSADVLGGIVMPFTCGINGRVGLPPVQTTLIFGGSEYSAGDNHEGVTMPHAGKLYAVTLHAEDAIGNLTLSDRIDLVIGNLPQPLKFIKDLFDGTLFATIADFINLDIDWETFKTNAVDAVSGIVDGFADLVKGPVNLIIEALNSVLASISFSKTFENPITGTPYTFSFDLSEMQIPMLAKGGIVTGPTLAMIGEAGPEAVVPLDGKNAPGGQTFNITVNPSGITDRSDKREMARQIGNLIQQEVSRALGGTTMRGRM